MENTTSSREIDLLQVLAKFYRALKKNKIVVILCLLCGLAGGLLLSNYSKDPVKASMMIVTDLLSENEIKFLADQFAKADTIPGITADQKILIKEITFEVKSEDVLGKSPNVSLQLTATVFDSKVLIPLQNSVVNFLNHAEPTIRKKENKKEFYVNMIRKIDSELAALDNVKSQIDNKAKATFLDPSDLFTKSVELYDKKVLYKIALDELHSVQVIKGFGALTKSAKWPKMFYAFLGLLVGFGIALVIMFMQFFNEYYRGFANSK